MLLFIKWKNPNPIQTSPYEKSNCTHLLNRELTVINHNILKARFSGKKP